MKNSTNALVKLMTLGRIKKDLQRYFFRQGKFSMVDLRLLSGIIHRNFKKS